MPRELMFFAYDEAARAGPYDEKPMLPPEVDLQIHLSRNDRPQPFFLICQHDTVLVVMGGEGTVEFKNTSVLRQTYETGDFIYVPAGVPHRILPSTESIHLRYKLPESELEGVVWYCTECGKELHRDVWSLNEALAQEGYARASEAFNDAAATRKCAACGHVHPPIDLDGFRWRDLARELRAAEAETAENRSNETAKT